MELTANVWPVVDAATGFVLRFLIRAYAFDASDEDISRSLRTLAPTDFRMARLFPVPERFVMVSEHGSLPGCVTISQFHGEQGAILEGAFRALEEDFVKIQGIDVAGDQTIGIGLIPHFPPNPYLLVTSLMETADGTLVPAIAPR